jgi:hypothetical protein
VVGEPVRELLERGQHDVGSRGRQVAGGRRAGRHGDRVGIGADGGDHIPRVVADVHLGRDLAQHLGLAVREPVTDDDVGAQADLVQHLVHGRLDLGADDRCASAQGPDRLECLAGAGEQGRDGYAGVRVARAIGGQG